MKNSILLLCIGCFLIIDTATKLSAQDVLLYSNIFESPLATPVPNCGPDLDVTYVNDLWGGTGLGTGGGGLFQQINTVETILINGPNDQYTDPSGRGGDYCLSMLSTAEDDRLALTLNSQLLPYINLAFLMSPIDVAACGGLFGTDVAKMHVTAFDSPGGDFSFFDPGTLLDEDTIVGSDPGATPFTFNWVECNASLLISSSVDGYITVVFDLINSGYAAIDSIVIKSSVSADMHSQYPNEMGLQISPIPFTDAFTISGTHAGADCFLMNSTGQQIMHVQANEATTVIATNGLTAGLFVLLYAEDGNISRIPVIKYE